MKDYTILHLEDNPVFIELMEALFYKIKDMDIVYNGVQKSFEAIDRLRNQLPDLFIVDLMLENDYDPQPGVLFIKEVRKSISKDVPIMVLTANTDHTPKKDLHGLINWIETKDFSPSNFRKKISRILKGDDRGEDEE